MVTVLPGDWVTTLSINTVMGTGQESYIVDAGFTYTVAEGTLPENWRFTGLQCDGTGPYSVDLTTRTATIGTLQDGQVVACTFENERELVPPPPVGGQVYSVNMFSTMALCLALFSTLAIAAAYGLTRRREGKN